MRIQFDGAGILGHFWLRVRFHELCCVWYLFDVPVAAVLFVTFASLVMDFSSKGYRLHSLLV